MTDISTLDTLQSLTAQDPMTLDESFYPALQHTASQCQYIFLPLSLNRRSEDVAALFLLVLLNFSDGSIPSPPHSSAWLSSIVDSRWLSIDYCLPVPFSFPLVDC